MIGSFVARQIDRQAKWMAHFLHSRAAYVWLVYGTILWIPLVVAGIDGHGFLYLYIATSLSLITQVPLAMLAYWAARDSKHGEELTIQTLKNQSDMLTFLLNKFGELEEDIREELEAHHEGQTVGVLPVVDHPVDVEEEG